MHLYKEKQEIGKELSSILGVYNFPFSQPWWIGKLSKIFMQLRFLKKISIKIRLLWNSSWELLCSCFLWISLTNSFWNFIRIFHWIFYHVISIYEVFYSKNIIWIYTTSDKIFWSIIFLCIYLVLGNISKSIACYLLQLLLKSR